MPLSFFRMAFKNFDLKASVQVVEIIGCWGFQPLIYMVPVGLPVVGKQIFSFPSLAFYRLRLV